MENTTNRRPAPEVFRVLADCYHLPDQSLISRTEGLEAMVEPLGSETASLARNIRNTLKTADMESLLVDFAKLFVGPFELAAPPFGSVYLEDNYRLMGESTVDVKQLYQKAGLEMSAEFSNPPDHITAELEFLYFLHMQEAALSADDGQAAEDVRDMRGEFLRHHLGAWGGAFADKVCGNASTELYRNLGKLTKLVLEHEVSGKY